MSASILVLLCSVAFEAFLLPHHFCFLKLLGKVHWNASSKFLNIPLFIGIKNLLITVDWLESIAPLLFKKISNLTFVVVKSLPNMFLCFCEEEKFHKFMWL